MKTLIFFLFLVSSAFGQPILDSAKKSERFDTNKIADKFELEDNSYKYDYDKYIWNDKRNFSEVLDELPGNYIVTFNTGGRNLIFSQNIYNNNNGYFRNGIDISDRYFNDFDIENFSILELDKIEEISPVKSFLYSLNSTGKLFNFIEKDNFIPNTFAQFRYSQDRHGSLFADLNLTLPLSNKINFTIGINNHFSESRYRNSEFSFWRGKFKLNYFASPKHNFFFEIDYTHNKRDLNGGLVLASNEILSDPLSATVNNPNAYEDNKNIFWHIGYTGNIFKSQKSTTQLWVYGILSDRNFSDISNNSRYYLNFNTKSYNIEFRQRYNISFTENVNINMLLGYNSYFNNYGSEYQTEYSRNINSILGSFSFNYYKFVIDVFSRFNRDNENYYNYGVETRFNLFSSQYSHLEMKAGINKTSSQALIQNSEFIKSNNNYYELCLNYCSEYIESRITVYNIKNYYGDNSLGISLFADYNTENIKSYFSLDKFDTRYFPDYNFKFDLAYQNFYFGRKLQLRLGMNLKFAYKFEPVSYNNSNYRIDFNIQAPVQNSINLDFYIGARIGTANINFTIANIFNNLNYNSAIYPLDDRGGFMKFLSRFTIVWDFLN